MKAKNVAFLVFGKNMIQRKNGLTRGKLVDILYMLGSGFVIVILACLGAGQLFFFIGITVVLIGLAFLIQEVFFGPYHLIKDVPVRIIDHFCGRYCVNADIGKNSYIFENENCRVVDALPTDKTEAYVRAGPVDSLKLMVSLGKNTIDSADDSEEESK